MLYVASAIKPIRMYRLIYFFTTVSVLLLSGSALTAQSPDKNSVTVIVTDNSTGEWLEYASVALIPDNGREQSAFTDDNGIAFFSIPSGKYKLSVRHLSYANYTDSLVVNGGMQYEVKMRVASTMLKDVVVTAYESSGMTSASKIGRDAMAHLQPSSFTDLLSLLPGGRAETPSLTSMNRIRLRESLDPVSSNDYATSSLGTSFVVDGAPISTDANMQYPLGSDSNYLASYYRDATNKGVDMRTISTDDIENVEIVRGIPSVEYGNLTSGLVKIERKRGGQNMEARFKADMSSKLYYVGKGFESERKRMTLNLGVDFLDGGSDPRDVLNNYKRLTGSIRMSKVWIRGNVAIDWSSNIDYTGSFDTDKVDPDLNSGKDDSYKSSYNNMGWSNTIKIRPTSNPNRIFSDATITASLNYQHDVIKVKKYIQPRRIVVTDAVTEGIHDGVFLVNPYLAEHKTDGKPFNAYVKGVANFNISSPITRNEIKVGGDWKMDKNYGDGQIFDPLQPLYTTKSNRPVSFKDTPARHEIAVFAEDYTRIELGNSELSVMAGVRAASMLNMGSEYKINGRFYLDPRVNVKYRFAPVNLAGKRMIIELSAGYGIHTKFPTTLQLHPYNSYVDIVRLNYWSTVNSDYSIVSLQTHIIDPTNYNLKPARNHKYELRGDIYWAGNRLSVTWFREDMKSGFRSMSNYMIYHYRSYSASSIDHSAVTGAPTLDDFDYTYQTTMGLYSVTSNGSRTLKDGVEFTLSTRRFEAIATRVTVTGAWFRTRYTNSEPFYMKATAVVGNTEKQIAGLYTSDDGYERESFNTNFMFDTHIPRIGMNFSLTLQCVWYKASQRLPYSNTPIKYVDEFGVMHDFTEESANDPYLKLLIRSGTSSDSAFERSTTPFSMNVNLKITKKLYKDRISIAMFANNLVNWLPNYVRNGYVFRRSATPYFGMELNFKI